MENGPTCTDGSSSASADIIAVGWIRDKMGLAQFISVDPAMPRFGIAYTLRPKLCEKKKPPERKLRRTA
jgi:hypothetical protein